ncbi:hypothetical protein QQF64_021729 [Cirrhinus molitorella]|uniref:Uncharacterized protein n=2 Tax=Cirrhinus molitorella TaxID=172907 RepID=A0AA88P546_9TELE|nr:hypothetical protein Q8A67_024704 [Cirrhinus molitorella]
MAMLLWVLLFSAGVLFSEAQESFSNLPDIYKKGVELVINSHDSIQNHFLFLESIHHAEIEAGFDVTHIYHNFYLKATKCKSGTDNADTTACEFRNDQVQEVVDCVICYKISAGEIDEMPKPYFNCMLPQLLSKEIKREREIGCFHAGFGHLTPTPLPSTQS